MRAAAVVRCARLLGRIEQHARWGAVALAAVALAVAVRWGAFDAGGSDSHCYLEQAAMWEEGRVLGPQPWRVDLPGAGAELALVPTGFIPSPRVPGGIAPICPPGLALLMAGARRAAGSDAVFAVVPLLGALAAWCAFVLGRRLAGPLAGLASAALAVASPVFLFQLVQPMSDVPAAALWLLALAALTSPSRWRHLAAGLAASAAILVRPNLAPIAVPMSLYALLEPVMAGGSASGSGRVWNGASDPGTAVSAVRRLRSLGWLLAGLGPGVAAVAAVQDALYGSPLSSGYGSASLLFSLSHLGPNLARYPRWLVGTQSPAVLLALLAPFVLADAGSRPGAGATGRRPAGASPSAVAWLLLGAAGVTAGLHLLYVPFDDWWYLRFWLPAVTALVILAPAVVVELGRRAGACTLLVVAVGGVAALSAWQIDVARGRGVFTVAAREARFRRVAEYVGNRFPAGAVFFTIWHSGSVRYHGGRQTVVWDAIAADDLDRAFDALADAGRPAFLLLEDWEEQDFRARFGGRSRYGDLDWPPTAQLGRAVRIYDPADRARHLAGERVATAQIPRR